MKQSMLFQLNMVREWCIEIAESCPEDIAEIQLDIFNNTIHWQIGHILTVAERMLFNYPQQSAFIPHTFTNWFEAGTRPDTWIDSPPSIKNLITRLKEQHARMLSIPPERFNNRLDKPYFGFNSFGECAGFVAIHEALHLGKIEEMLRVLRHRICN